MSTVNGASKRTQAPASHGCSRVSQERTAAGPPHSMTLSKQLRSVTAERKALIATRADQIGSTPGEIELALRDLGYLKPKSASQLQKLDPDGQLQRLTKTIHDLEKALAASGE
jgi:hypothetical protein